MKKIINVSHSEAKTFFMKKESFCSIDLPKYIDFSQILSQTASSIEKSKIENCKKKRPNDVEGVNYVIFSNKDGQYQWRPLQIIHPILYVLLVNEITDKTHWGTIVKRFKKFQKNPKIKCLSIPIISETTKSDRAELINHWWMEFEQESIKMSLEFDYILSTDITDCYGSIYTHSIAWALHNKDVAKTNKTKQDFIGNIIDNFLQMMSNGQTNGIPQGSVIMDFIAEILLGYIDNELSKKLKSNKISVYQILRYRDDYKIFTKKIEDCEMIAKLLSETLSEVSLKLNSSKTEISKTIIEKSLKADKYFYLTNRHIHKGLQAELLLIHNLSTKYKNSGSIAKLLTRLHKKIENLKKINADIVVLISIVTDIAVNNPKIYSQVIAIISKLLAYVEEEERKSIIKKIHSKFEKLPNNAILQIWMHRLLLGINDQYSCVEKLCSIANGDKVELWKSDWVADNKKFRAALATSIINQETLNSFKNTAIGNDEINLFSY